MDRVEYVFRYPNLIPDILGNMALPFISFCVIIAIVIFVCKHIERKKGIKAIDDKGRVFGKINLLDALVIVFILFLIPVFHAGYVIMNAPLSDEAICGLCKGKVMKGPCPHYVPSPAPSLEHVTIPIAEYEKIKAQIKILEAEKDKFKRQWEHEKERIRRFKKEHRRAKI